MARGKLLASQFIIINQIDKKSPHLLTPIPLNILGMFQNKTSVFFYAQNIAFQNTVYHLKTAVYTAV